MSADAVEVTGLTYTYPTAEEPSLRDVSLRVPTGTMCAVVGANGAGKTTLCHALRGFVPNFYKGELTGSVRVLGTDLAETDGDDLARTVGYVFANPFTQMSGITSTVFDELAFGLGNLGVPPLEIRERVEEMLERARLTELRDRHPFQLSGGQQQRVALASVLVMNQPLLVIDEPTSQLDPQSTDEVFTLITQARDAGRTIVLVEHAMEHVAEHADLVVVLDAGRVVATGTPAEIFPDPATAAHGVRVPEAVRLTGELRQRGVDVPGAPLTIPALAAALGPTRAGQ
ncbi:energy-coupling factor ABC transporter ATP-binding protein [Georgenia faecalis]|uniref:Energy-coupling factor ABC transporter ATP-binding protein n=1 Tax=Georgenia faecalis TaxID=2483799 RepID=A0ABV9DCJ2_9MICO|nr:ABC transporter ATP-binding protein [Georgenia faecalis]